MKRPNSSAFARALLGLGMFGFAVMTLGVDKPKAKGGKPSSKSGAAKSTQERENSAKPGASENFTSPDGKHNAWKVTIAGGRRLATPAFADGKLFLGGGFGSHEFYAFDAETGKSVWQYITSDDGPTAAVIADGYVAFNTESCELEVLD